MLLALDTSTSFASMALVQNHTGLLAELNWYAGQSHSQDLFASLSWLMASHHLTPADLTAVAVATGPGSFNGLRVALAAAKSFCFALGLPLYACPTLDVIAWGCAASGRTAPARIWALLDAGRGQLYAAQYPGIPGDDPFLPINGYHVLTPTELAEQIVAESSPESVLFCGEWLPSAQATLADILGGRAIFASTFPGRRASWLAVLALEQARRGEAADIMSVEPLYLRRPAISKSSKPELLSQSLESASRAEGSETLLGTRGDMHALHR